MLLIEPPLTSNEWVHVKAENPCLACFFSRYLNDYVSAVMSLSCDQIARIIVYLCQGHDDLEVDADSFHDMVQRELRERDFEASGKVARLVILCALGETLPRHGCKLHSRTERMLARCWELIPSVLMLAIDDHFGFLTADCC